MHISVAMCTYNGARYLHEQLESIATQTLSPDELVVCDDGSSDETVRIIESFAGEVKFPVRLIGNEEKLGPARNFEKAITLARGELIALSDQDDCWYPQKLSRLASILDGDPSLGGVFTNGTLMDESSRPLNQRLWDRVRYRPAGPSGDAEETIVGSLLKGDVVTGATLMIRAEVRKLIFPVPASWMHDGWIAWMLTLYSKIAAVEEPLIAYRVHQAQHAGLSAGSLGERIATARRLGREECLLTVQQFEELRAHWMAHPGKNFAANLRQIEEKLEHLRCRLNLPRNFVQRTYRVASAFSRYQRYGYGVATLCKDLVVY